jgi:hypothetical protein
MHISVKYINCGGVTEPELLTRIGAFSQSGLFDLRGLFNIKELAAWLKNQSRQDEVFRILVFRSCCVRSVE